MVVASNSSRQLLFDPNPLAPCVFAWMPYNASARPTFFYEQPPKIVQDPPPEATSGTDTRFVLPASRSVSSEALKTATQEVSTAHIARCYSSSTSRPKYAVLEVSNATEPAEVSKGFSDNLLFHVSEMTKMMDMLNDQRQAPNLTVPHRKSKPFNVTQASNDTIVYAKDEESSRLHHIRRERLRARQQINPDITTELDLSDAQLNNLRAHVNRRFLTGYDCSNPREVKPTSSFVRDPCEPAEANEKDTYKIDPPPQYQIVQYETRREFKGTRCEKYISQVTYYCGAADHSSPLPQEIFYRRPKAMTRNDCQIMASIGQYVAGDSKTYPISQNVRREISYFAKGTATAYTGFYGSQISCTGGQLMVDGVEIYNMVMYVTMSCKEKFISRDDEDGLSHILIISDLLVLLRILIVLVGT